MSKPTTPRRGTLCIALDPCDPGQCNLFHRWTGRAGQPCIEKVGTLDTDSVHLLLMRVQERMLHEHGMLEVKVQFTELVNAEPEGVPA